MSALQLVTPPAVEPITLAVAKAHLRLDHAADDALLADLIVGVRQLAELYTSRAFITQGYKFWLDAAPAGRSLNLPRAPLQSITAIRTYDEAGVASVMPDSLYMADNLSQPGRVVLRQSAMWPTPGRVVNGFEVQYNAGYGATAADVPLALRQGMLAHLAHLYAYRGDGLMPDGHALENALPSQALALYAPYRLLRGVT